MTDTLIVNTLIGGMGLTIFVATERRNQMNDYDDYCYECTGYGDDYYYDEEKGEYVKACDDCSYNIERRADD